MISSAPSVQPQNNSHAHLDSIFESVKRQVDLWGENAKWKIDLVLLDNPQQQQQSVIHPLLSPQQLHPNAITTPSMTSSSSSNTIQNIQLPITAATQYPWDYTPPTTNEWRQRENDELYQKLHESIERQKYLESIIWAQAEQIRNSRQNQPREEDTIKTMKNIFLMNENEQKNRYKMETSILQKDIETLKKKLQKMASTLYEIEKIQIPPEDAELDKEALLKDRNILLRKLYLAELRLSARDAELEYLHEVVDSLKSSTFNKPPQPHPPYKKIRKGPPYLLQQQFSPRSSEVRLYDQQPLTALDSLGIVADQMLSDPEFDSNTSITAYDQNTKRVRSRLDDRRSQRSMDSAVTLLTMPQLITPSAKIPENKSPESNSSAVKKSRTTYMRWTEEEDDKLRKAVQKYGPSNWEACARDLEGRTNIQCRNRWIRYLENKEPKTDARQSPSIAALLNDDSRVYTPPSPAATPKNVKRVKTENTSLA